MWSVLLKLHFLFRFSKLTRRGSPRNYLMWVRFSQTTCLLHLFAMRRDQVGRVGDAFANHTTWRALTIRSELQSKVGN